MRQLISVLVYLLVVSGVAFAQGIDITPTPIRSDTIYYDPCADSGNGTCPTSDTVYGPTWPAYAFVPWKSGVMCCTGDYDIYYWGIAGSIANALSTWSSNNQSQNLSNVTFYNCQSCGGGTSVTFYTHTGWDPSNTNRIATTGYIYMRVGSTWQISGGTVEFWIGSPAVDYTSPDFTSFEQRVTMHEIGHTMGLDDQPVNYALGQCGGEGQQWSVMNQACGVNDSMYWLPFSPQSGDNQAINSIE